jgi:hypothetical protein
VLSKRVMDMDDRSDITQNLAGHKRSVDNVVYAWIACRRRPFGMVQPRRPLDPQDVGVGDCPGHWRYHRGVHDQLTCGSSARVQGVWSPNGPQQHSSSRTRFAVLMRIDLCGLVALVPLTAR